MENRSAHFANNYYLPNKFGIDLRYSEFSALIRSGQMKRDDALQQIKKPKPSDPDILEEIKTRVGFSDADWEAIMTDTPKHFSDYQTYKKSFEQMKPFFYVLYKAGYVTKSFYVKYACKNAS